MQAIATHGTNRSSRPAIRPIMFIPGMMFWGLVAIGIATEQTAFFGVAIALFVAIAIYALTRAVRRSNQRKAENRRVWLEGADARAQVVGLTATGGSFNDHPYVDLDLELRESGTTPRRVSVRALVSMIAIPRVQPSCEIAVKVDRRDSSVVVIDPALTPYGY